MQKVIDKIENMLYNKNDNRHLNKPSRKNKNKPEGRYRVSGSDRLN